MVPQSPVWSGLQVLVALRTGSSGPAQELLKSGLSTAALPRLLTQECSPLGAVLLLGAAGADRKTRGNGTLSEQRAWGWCFWSYKDGFF